MSWTKRQFITQAFEEIGLAAYVYDLTPDQLQSAARRLDAMVAGWDANGVRISYPFESNPDAINIDLNTGVPDFANEAIYLGLAVRLGPAFGKNIAPETKMFADMAYNNMANQVALPTIERELPRTMPRGTGTKPWRNFNNPFIYGPQSDSDINAGPDGPITLE